MNNISYRRDEIPETSEPCKTDVSCRLQQTSSTWINIFRKRETDVNSCLLIFFKNKYKWRNVKLQYIRKSVSNTKQTTNEWHQGRNFQNRNTSSEILRNLSGSWVVTYEGAIEEARFWEVCLGSGAVTNGGSEILRGLSWSGAVTYGRTIEVASQDLRSLSVIYLFGWPK